MSHPLKPIIAEPLGAFLTKEFIRFAKRWPQRQDLERLTISFSPNGYPLLGNPDTLRVLFRGAAFPARAGNNPEDARLLFVLYGRAPDLVLSLLRHLREKLSKASPHRKRLLDSPSDRCLSPKAMMTAMPVTIQGSGAGGRG